MENARNTDTAVPGGRSDTLAGDRTGEYVKKGKREREGGGGERMIG